MNNRIIWADSLKGWLILLVILGHAIQIIFKDNFDTVHLWNIIYSFHMPAFMAISGWLSFKSAFMNDNFSVDWKSLFRVCIRRGSQLLIPFFVWSYIQHLVWNGFTLEGIAKVIIHPDAYFWFLWVLFWICVVFNFAQLFASKLKINEMVLILGTCLLLFGLMVVMDIRIFGFQFLAYYFLFYTLGYSMHKYEDASLNIVLSNPFVMLALATLWAFLAWGWTMHGLPSWVPAINNVPSALLQYVYRGITALVAIVVLMRAAPRLLNGLGRLNEAICTLGVFSLGLYVVHLSVMEYVVAGINSIIPSIGAWACVALTFAISLAISYLVVWLLSKNRYTARIFLGKIIHDKV